MSAPPPPEPALQDTSRLHDVSPEAVATALAISSGELSIVGCVELLVEHLARDEADGVTVALTRVPPEHLDNWTPLGARAWLREWMRPGASCSVAPREGAGPEDAFSLPWISDRARLSVVALPDIDRLPSDADQDRRELAGCGVQALVTYSMLRGGLHFGSIGTARETAGRWSATYIADFRLLSAALTTRLVEAHAARGLAEAMRRADAAHASKEQFFAALGHELRTPITVILGTAELQGEEARERAASDTSGVAASVASDAQVMLRAAEQLHAIVEDLLTTGEELGGRAETQWIDVAEALADVVHWLAAPARTGNVTVSPAVPPGIRVRTTPSALRQILTNLVGNAIAYNLSGGSVRVSAARAVNEFGRPRVRIRVEDTGRGLTPEQQRRVFDPFVRFAGPEIRGTGLGLSLSRSLAERDGGLMGVESVPGGGSAFWLDLASIEDGPDDAPGHHA